MTNGTTPTENGVADTAAMLAAMTNEAAATTSDIPAEPAEPKAPTFDDLGLHPDVKQALDDMGYFSPTPVQTAVFKPVSEGKDLLVQSRTGTGKTTAFGLPIVNRMVPAVRQPQALILTPTRELALQVARELTQIGKHRGIVIECVYGGAPIGKQITALRNGVHVIVGTPGRVLDHIGRRTLDCKTISTFVLDECDEMLSMGFLEDIEKITSYLPDKHQTLLFSATMPDEVQRYARRHMKNQEVISLSRDSISVTDIHHAYYIVSGIARSRDLLKILFAENPDSAIIFCNTRDETTLVAKFLQKQGLDAEPLSSDLSQADRERVMGRMKAKNLRFLCATDVAARGIDISNLSHVINYSVPESPEVYVHRTGRTGRAGKKGTALSLVGPRELGNFRYVRLTFGIKPEERLLPKDDIFIGKLKVPLPPVGAPQPPDPVQILIRGVTGTPSDLEKGILEKLLRSANGQRVLGALVADKLNQLSTRSTRPRRERAERTEDAGAAEGAPGEERGERPRFGEDRGERRFDRDRGERGDRPRFGGDRDRGDRPRFGGDRDRGDRPRFGEDRGPRGEGGERGERRFDRDRGDRPRFGEDRGPRAEGGERGERGDRPRFGEDRGPRAEGSERAEAGATVATGTTAAAGAEVRTERPEGERPRFDDRGERGERPRFGDRDRDRGERRFDRDRGERGGERGDRGGDRGERRFDRDRGERRDRDDRHRDRPERRDERPAEQPVIAATAQDTTVPAEAVIETSPTATALVAEAHDVPVTTEARTSEPREGREHRDRREGRDRHERRDDRRDRGEARTEARTEAPAAAAAEAPAESHAKAEDTKGKRRGARSEPTAETKEFWETWAETKATRVDEPKAEEPAEAQTEERTERRSHHKRDEKPSRDRGRGRDRDRKGATETKDAKDSKDAKEPRGAKKDEERPSRSKRDTVVTAPADGSQARLFISLGKKHGVSADDLRTLLAGPIGGDTARIGSVSLRDSHAHVRVPEDLVEQIIAGVHGTLHNDHNVTVERARA